MRYSTLRYVRSQHMTPHHITQHGITTITYLACTHARIHYTHHTYTHTHTPACITYMHAIHALHASHTLHTYARMHTRMHAYPTYTHACTHALQMLHAHIHNTCTQCNAFALHHVKSHDITHRIHA